MIFPYLDCLMETKGIEPSVIAVYYSKKSDFTRENLTINLIHRLTVSSGCSARYSFVLVFLSGTILYKCFQAERW